MEDIDASDEELDEMVDDRPKIKGKRKTNNVYITEEADDIVDFTDISTTKKISGKSVWYFQLNFKDLAFMFGQMKVHGIYSHVKPYKMSAVFVLLNYVRLCSWTLLLTTVDF